MTEIINNNHPVLMEHRLSKDEVARYCFFRMLAVDMNESKARVGLYISDVPIVNKTPVNSEFLKPTH